MRSIKSRVASSSRKLYAGFLPRPEKLLGSKASITACAASRCSCVSLPSKLNFPRALIVPVYQPELEAGRDRSAASIRSSQQIFVRSYVPSTPRQLDPPLLLSANVIRRNTDNAPIGVLQTHNLVVAFGFCVILKFSVSYSDTHGSILFWVRPLNFFICFFKLFHGLLNGLVLQLRIILDRIQFF